ncbi:MAG: flagellar motor switch protein FliG [Pseudohongiellaceae bacterium]
MATNNPNNSADGLHKAGVLLMALEEDNTAEVFQHLSPREIQEISQHMAGMDHVSHEEMQDVLNDFHEESEQFSVLSLDSNEYLRKVLTKVMGAERAASLLEDIMETSSNSSGIDTLNMIDASSVAEMIRDEHPQIIATILVHLERNQAAAILELFDDKLRNDVMLRVATFSGVQPAALQELTEVLGSMLDGQNLKRSKMGGVRTAAEILNLMNSSLEDVVIDTVRGYSEDLAQNILDEMFLFENLLEVDNRSIKLILKEVDSNSLAVALKGESNELRDKFTNNMSQRAASLLLEDMEARGRIRVSEVEAEQKNILQVVRRLTDSGDIVLLSGDDDYV